VTDIIISFSLPHSLLFLPYLVLFHRVHPLARASSSCIYS
jgi:hypothetical protein